MELDLRLAKVKSGDATPSGSNTYNHFSGLLQRIALKQFEVDTQQGYVTLVDEMVTHSTLTAQSNSLTPNTISHCTQNFDKNGTTVLLRTCSTLLVCFCRQQSCQISLKRKFTEVNSSISDGPFFGNA